MQGGLISGDQPVPATRFETEGLNLETGAPVTAAVALGTTVAVAHGDGCVRLFAGDEPVRTISAHRGAVLAMAAIGTEAVLTGGDDGRCLRISMAGEVEELADFGGAWVDCVAAHGTGWPAGLFYRAGRASVAQTGGAPANIGTSQHRGWFVFRAKGSAFGRGPLWRCPRSGSRGSEAGNPAGWSGPGRISA